MQQVIDSIITPAMFNEKYSDVFAGDEMWKEISTTPSVTYAWDDKSTYIRCPDYFDKQSESTDDVKDITGARTLAIFGDSITTDHISPAGNINKDSPAAEYLREHGVKQADFNSYGSRRGNHEVMVRGTFANVQIKNKMADGKEGWYTKYDGEIISTYDASCRYKQSGTPLVVFAGAEYGTGSFQRLGR